MASSEVVEGTSGRVAALSTLGNASSALGRVQRDAAVAEMLARRSYAGAAGPALLAACLAFFLRDHHDLRFFLTVMLGLGLMRAWIAARRVAIYAYSSKVWFVLFRAGALCTSLTWGICSAVLAANDHAYATRLILLMTAGIAAGATVSLSPDRWLVRLYVTTLLAPLAVGLVLVEAPQAWPTVICMAMFVAFMMVQANQLGDHFHGSLDAAALLDTRARALELAGQRADEAKLEADTANRAKSAFLANMSHELRTPLTAIIGYSQLLLGKVSQHERIEFAETIRRNGDHLLNLLNDVLDISKIEADKMTVVRQPFSVRNVLADVESLMRVRASDRGLFLQVRAVTPFPRVINADPTRVRQILLNLVGNAIKFTQEGGVRVRVHVDGTPSELVIDVEDTGPGLSAEQQGQLFQAFSQAESTGEVARSGTGLGLHISRRLARLMNGEVRLRSELGRGSVFSLVLPLDGADTDFVTNTEASIRPRARGSLPEASALRGVRILLAEDGADNQRLLRTILTAAGALVEVVADGEEAVAAALEAQATPRAFDVVLMDMEMPKLDGYGATARLRAVGYDGPIVALTAHAMATHRERTAAAGCDAHVVKPIDRSELVETVLSLAQRLEVPAAFVPLPSSLEDDPIFMDLLPGYIDNLQRFCAELSAAHRHNDRSTVASIAHQLAGTGGSYGYDAITDAARELEHAVGDARAIEPLLRALVTLCERAVATHRLGQPREPRAAGGAW